MKPQTHQKHFSGVNQRKVAFFCDSADLRPKIQFWMLFQRIDKAIEGKRELAQVINNFSSNEISADAVKEILSSAIRYTLNFDLLVPNYEDMKIITVNDILQLEEQTNLLRTGKRLGFRFEQDKNE
jgi:hypothetical protein